MKNFEKIFLTLFIVLLFMGCTKEVVQDIVQPEPVPEMPADIVQQQPVIEENKSEPADIVPKVVLEMVEVKIMKYTIEPTTVTIKQGETVKWTNTDNVKHRVTFKESWDMRSDLLAQGESYTFTFNKKGTFTFVDVPYGMRGTIIVE